MNSKIHCPAGGGAGLAPSPGCTCDGDAHTSTPAICTTCNDTGRQQRAA
jgi:hypothetical protein